MTWSVRVTRPDGTVPEGTWCACQKCKHGLYDLATKTGASIMPCYVSKVANQLGPLLTAVDVDANGRMASGNADLKCSGFDPMDEPAVQPEAKPYPLEQAG